MEPTTRILFVTDSIREPLTGVGRIAVTWLRELVALGADVTAVDHEANPLAESICGKAVVLPCPGAFLRMGRWHLSLLSKVASLGIEHDVLFDPTGYPNARGSHPAEVALVHDLSMFRGGLYRPGKRAWFRLFYGRALRKARLAVCVSEFTRGQLLARFGLDPEKVIVVPNSLDPSFLEPPRGAPHKDQPVGPFFLTVGTIERRKNVERLLRAWRGSRLPDHTLVLAGRRGAGAEQILRGVHGDRVVHIEGADDDQLKHLYRNATALLFPSLEEGFGLPILEAFQSDLPVLTSAVTAMPEVAGDAAVLVDPLDVDAIRDGIETLARDGSLRDDLVAAGRRRLPRFAARRHAETLLARMQGLKEKA